MGFQTFFLALTNCAVCACMWDLRAKIVGDTTAESGCSESPFCVAGLAEEVRNLRGTRTQARKLDVTHE